MRHKTASEPPVVFFSSSETETLRLGFLLGKFVLPGMLILLSGDLGAGKTVFVRGLASAMNVENVRSPSFTLINEYNGKHHLLVHADLYRLEPEAVDDLGLEDYLDDNCILVVEWPERWFFPPLSQAITINIEARGENGRVFTFSSKNMAFRETLKKLLQDYEVKDR